MWIPMLVLALAGVLSGQPVPWKSHYLEHGDGTA
jgi:hypothetical protein